MAKNVKFSIHGACFDCETPFGKTELKLQLNGMFSVYNALAAITTGLAMGIDLTVIKAALEETPSVAGRFEIVTKEPLVIVDYAHTPDGLENVLKSAREITPKDGNLICLFGCGGNRDCTKRPKMGKIAQQLCDKIIITSDNPRTEEPASITKQIEEGIKKTNGKYTVIVDRIEAIREAIKMADKKDIIVLAGKGHEPYQEINGVKYPFDERIIVNSIINGTKIK